MYEVERTVLPPQPSTTSPTSSSTNGYHGSSNNDSGRYIERYDTSRDNNNNRDRSRSPLSPRGGDREGKDNRGTGGYNNDRDRGGDRYGDRNYNNNSYRQNQSHGGGSGGGRGQINSLANKVPPSRVLGVFGLHPRTTERDLEDEFGKYGKIVTCTLVMDRYTHQSRCFAFISFDSIEESIRVKEATANLELHGYVVRIDYSASEKPHSPTPGQYTGNPRFSPYGRFDRRGGNSNGGGGYRRDDRGGGGGGGYRRDNDRYDNDRDRDGGRDGGRDNGRGGYDRDSRGGYDRDGGRGGSSAGNRYDDRDRDGGNRDTVGRDTGARDTGARGGYDRDRSRSPISPRDGGGRGGYGGGDRDNNPPSSRDNRYDNKDRDDRYR